MSRADVPIRVRGSVVQIDIERTHVARSVVAIATVIRGEVALCDP